MSTKKNWWSFNPPFFLYKLSFTSENSFVFYLSHHFSPKYRAPLQH